MALYTFYNPDTGEFGDAYDVPTEHVAQMQSQYPNTPFVDGIWYSKHHFCVAGVPTPRSENPATWDGTALVDMCIPTGLCCPALDFEERTVAAVIPIDIDVPGTYLFELRTVAHFPKTIEVVINDLV